MGGREVLRSPVAVIGLVSLMVEGVTTNSRSSALSEFKIFSSDSHIVETADLWTSRLEPKYRDQGPCVRRVGDYDRWFLGDDADIGGIGAFIGAGLRYTDPSKITFEGTMEQVPLGGFDPDEHIRDMDIDGVDGGVVYPSIGLRMYHIVDSGLLNEVCRAYNDWLGEFCSANPDRVKGIALVNVDDVQEAVKELNRAWKMGLVGAMVSVYPPEDRSYRHPDYEPVWATAEDLDIPLSLHIGTSRPGFGGNRLIAFIEAGKRTAEGELANMDPPVRTSLAAMIFSGVFERHPGLKVVSVENGLAWIPWFLNMMDYMYRERQEQVMYQFKDDMIPRDFMRRNVMFSFQDDAVGIELRHHIGVDSLMWGNDYPHAESTFPRSRQVLDEILEGVPDDERAKIVGGNTKRVYHFD